jgi:hypothetical protein
LLVFAPQLLNLVHHVGLTTLRLIGRDRHAVPTRSVAAAS